MSKEFDIILVGATGFTGQLTGKWFASQAPTDLKWALAGRSSTKLEAHQNELRQLYPDRKIPQIIVADTLVDSDCTQLVKRTKVIVTTVGPYARLGEALLRACARNGVHYCDLTGEIPFVRAMLHKYEADAKSSGSMIVCCSGFDSIPVDLSNWAVAKYIREHHNAGTKNARSVIYKLKGGVSGGTLSSVFTLLDLYTLKDISAAHKPWSLSTVKGSAAQSNLPHVIWDNDFKTYAASWPMENVDRSVAARSWSLLHYGSQWTTYGYLKFTRMYQAYLYVGLLYLGTLLIGIRPLRYLLKRFVVQPGQGPSQQAMDEGHVQLKCIGESDRDPSKKAVATFEIKHGDPGYKGTAAMLASVGLTLALDSESIKQRGFLTPATLGESLVTRLADAGITLDVQDFVP